jgi:hypothetical protein
MKRIFGAVLMFAGASSLYLFTLRAAFFGRAALGEKLDIAFPIQQLGLDYPTDALLLMGALWGFLLGLWFIITGAEEAENALRGGRVARVMLLNGLLLISTLGVAYVGAKAHANATTIAIFGLVAAAQAVIGLILLILSLLERPKGIASLALGAVVTVGGVALGVLSFLWGGA